MSEVRLVNANEVADRLCNIPMQGRMMDIAHVTNALISTPTIEPPVVRGEWIEFRSIGILLHLSCSKCDYQSGVAWDYCPNCGADMRGVK